MCSFAFFILFSGHLQITEYLGHRSFFFIDSRTSFRVQSSGSHIQMCVVWTASTLCLIYMLKKRKEEKVNLSTFEVEFIV